MHDTQISYEISNALNSTTTSITTQVVFGVLNKKKHLTQKACLSVT